MSSATCSTRVLRWRTVPRAWPPLSRNASRPTRTGKTPFPAGARATPPRESGGFRAVRFAPAACALYTGKRLSAGADGWALSRDQMVGRAGSVGHVGRRVLGIGVAAAIWAGFAAAPARAEALAEALVKAYQSNPQLNA